MSKMVENSDDKNIAKKRKVPFEKFLSSRGIVVKENNNKLQLSSITEEKIFDQLEIIHTFHNEAMEYNSIGSKYIRNKIGKSIEKYKINIRSLKRDVNGFAMKSSLNEFENLLIDCSDKYIERAEKCIDLIMNSNYIGLIKRSMRRFEICLGNTYFTNLTRDKEIQIGTLKRCSYNMIEMDGVYFINKLKRNGYKMDYNILINKFCQVEGLTESSAEFIRALISYPHEYMKCVERYRENKKAWTINEFKINLYNSMKKDGESILGREQ